MTSQNRQRQPRHCGCAPAWSGMGKGETMKITERERRRLAEEFAWLEEHCWVLPPEERWLGKRDEKPNTATAPPPNAPEMTNTLSEEDLREAIRLGVKIAEEEALWKLTMKARQVRAAEIERRRPDLIVNTTLH